jgi:hypothetical protein
MVKVLSGLLSGLWAGLWSRLHVVKVMVRAMGKAVFTTMGRAKVMAIVKALFDKVRGTVGHK